MSQSHVYIDGDLSLTIQLDGDAGLLLQNDGEAGIVTSVTQVDDPYDGPTTVDPDFVGTTLETAQKIVLTDITVHPIQVESVSNPSGGRTVYIGGII